MDGQTDMAKQTGTFLQCLVQIHIKMTSEDEVKMYINSMNCF